MAISQSIIIVITVMAGLFILWYLTRKKTNQKNNHTTHSHPNSSTTPYLKDRGVYSRKFHRKTKHPLYLLKTDSVSQSIPQGTCAINIPGTSNILAVTTKPGKSYFVNQKTKMGVELDIANILQKFTSKEMEEGLLSIAFHPMYTSGDKRLYLSYTSEGNDIYGTYLVIQEFNVVSERDDATPSQIVPSDILIKIGFKENYHHGGTLAFGPDKLLYTATGDGGPQGDPNNSAQNPTSLLGKVIRFGLDGPELIGKGLRNPWVFSITSDQNMFIGDVGWNTVESVYILPDVTQATSAIPFNFGWPFYEGTVRRHPEDEIPEEVKDGYTRPIFEYPTSDKTGRAVIGGFIEPKTGLYIFGDFSGIVRALKYFSYEDPTESGWYEVAQRKLDSPVFSMGHNLHTNEIYVLTKRGIEKIWTVPFSPST